MNSPGHVLKWVEQASSLFNSASRRIALGMQSHIPPKGIVRNVTATVIVAKRRRILARHASVWGICAKVIRPERKMEGRANTTDESFRRPFRTVPDFGPPPATSWLANFLSSFGAVKIAGL